MEKLGKVERGLPRRVLGLAVVLAFVAACTDEPTVPLDDGADLPDDVPALAVQLTCTVDVRAGSMECDSSSPSSMNGPSMNLIVGSQHRLVRLANDTPVMEDDYWSANVTVQNLTLQPMATLDGTTPHLEGVRVFFVDEPSNGVTVSNYDGVGTFLGSGSQKYYAYAGASLGADGILSQGEVSAPKPWEFELNGATEFRFSILVSTTVPDPGAYSVHLTRVVAGAYHACGDGSDGKVYCWGQNYYGQLGDGTTTNRSTPVAVAAPAGISLSGVSSRGNATHTCAIGSDGKVYCWGQNDKGQLGDGTTSQQNSPVAARTPEQVRFAAVAVGVSRTCAESTVGTVYCWGRNDTGQLGSGAPTNRTTPVEVPAPANVTFSRVSAGGSHTCAHGSDGELYCWGYNAAGQLGTGSTSITTPVTPVSAPDKVTFSGVDAGFSHTCARGSDSNLYCWGNNSVGALGDGTTVRSLIPLAVSLPDVNVLSVTAGSNYTCAATDEGAYCWGSGFTGQLGDGTSQNRSLPVLVAGTRGE